MGATTEKVYRISLEMSQAQQALDTAVKSLADFKQKAADANTEAKESKATYQENAAALKELVVQQKALEAAKKTASAGAPAVAASSALTKNLAEQKLLNTIVQESKVVYLDAKAASEAAGAAVGRQAGTVKELAASVKDYGAAAKGAAKEFAPGTFGVIGAEIEQLKAELQNLVPGSAEAGKAIQELAGKQSALRSLANATAAANPRSQARAFGVLSQALVGVTGIATAAATAFGLSDATAQKYAQQMQGLLGVLYSLESVNKLANSENLSLIKGIVATGKAWFTAGESATAAGRATRLAISSTGIGLLILAVGALISWFVDLGSTVKGSESTFTKYKSVVVGVFDGLLEVVKDFYKLLFQLATLDLSGALATATGAGKDIADAYQKGRAGVIAEAQRAEIAHEVEKTARYIDIIKARGEDTLALEVANIRQKIDSEKAGSKEQLDVIRDYLVLKNQLLKRNQDEEKAQALARLQGLTAIEAANGRAEFEHQLAVKKEQQQQLDADLLAGRQNSAASIQLAAEIQALEDSHTKEVREKRQAAELAALDARISLRAAKGQEAFAQEVARAERELQFLRAAAQRDEAAITTAEAHKNDLLAARAYELTQRRHTLKLAELDAIISLENTKGEDSYREQVKREEKALAYMQQAGTRNLAAEQAQQSKVDNLKAARAVKEAADERAADLARLNARIAFLQASGEDTTQLQLNLKAKELNTLLNAAIRNEAAIIGKQGEIDAQIEQQQGQAVERRRAQRVEEFENEVNLLEKRGKDVLAIRLKFAREEVARDISTTEAGLAKRRADVQKVKELELELAQRGPDLGGVLLQKLFKVKDEDVLAVKSAITQAVGQVYAASQELAGAFLDGAMQQTEQALADAQLRLQVVTQQLSDQQSKADADAKALETATGARRDFLLARLAKERQEIDKIASAKAKAAAEEKSQLQEKHRLEKIGQELSAASALATNVAAAASAVYAGIKAVEKGSEVGFPLNIVAIASGIAAVIGAVASAKQLATATRYADGTGALGSDGVLRGPRHSQGGIPFTVAGRPGFEAEGGEAVTPVDATQRNGALLALIRTEGRSRTLGPLDMLRIANNAQAVVSSVRPTPANYFEPGGVLNKSGVSGGQASAADVGALRAEMQRNNLLLAQLVGSAEATAGNTARAADHAASTAANTDEIKRKPTGGGPRTYEDLQREDDMRRGVAQAQGFATL